VKLELIILLATLFIVAGAYTIKISDKAVMDVSANKELEFNDTIFTEVNASGFLGRATTQKGVRVNGVLMLDKLSIKQKLAFLSMELLIQKPLRKTLTQLMFIFLMLQIQMVIIITQIQQMIIILMIIVPGRKVMEY